MIAARVRLRRGWLTVAVCYNPGGAASYRDYEHYFFHLPPPVLIMGDFNAHHQHWDPTLLPTHRNTSGNTLHQVLMDSLHLSLLSPPGLATRFHPHTAAPSVLDLFIGDPAFTTCTFSTGPYMGSDHLPYLATLPNASPKQCPGCLPRWNITSEWQKFEEAQRISPNSSPMPLEEEAQTFHHVLEEAGKTAFRLTMHRTPRLAMVE